MARRHLSTERCKSQSFEFKCCRPREIGHTPTPEHPGSCYHISKPHTMQDKVQNATGRISMEIVAVLEMAAQSIRPHLAIHPFTQRRWRKSKSSGVNEMSTKFGIASRNWAFLPAALGKEMRCESTNNVEPLGPVFSSKKNLHLPAVCTQSWILRVLQVCVGMACFISERIHKPHSQPLTRSMSPDSSCP